MKSVITTSDIPLQPWKNGLGVTSELAISPPGADFKLNNFDWRISSAMVTGDNVFSHFAGYNRLLFVLTGHGIILNRKTTIIAGESHRFLGEDSIECSVVQGPVLDLGVIFQRDRFRSEMEVVTIDKPVDWKFEKGIYFLKGLTTGISVDDESVPAVDLIRIEAPDQGRITAEKYPAKILKISIRPTK